MSAQAHSAPRTKLPLLQRSRVREGRPFPLGATWDGLGVNFALFSAHATKVELACSTTTARSEIERIELPEYTDEVWHGYLPDARPGTVYGYRVHGPYEPDDGPPLQSEQAAARPLRQAHRRRARLGPRAVRLHDRRADDDLTFDERDSAPFMPKCRVVDPAFTWGGERRPQRSRGTARSSTRRTCAASPSGIRRCRRSCAAPMPGSARSEVDRLHQVARRHRGRAAAGPHLRRRQLPARQGADELLGLQHDRLLRARPALRGRRAIRLRRVQGDGGAPARRRPRGDPRRRLQPHRRGQRARARRCRFKGIDNASYYRLLPDEPRYYINDTGTGNTVNLSHPRVLQMVTDSLRYWATEMHVDGFRFDLGDHPRRASRTASTRAAASSTACRQDPVLSQRQADRRAVGLRPRRLPGRRLPAGLGRVERPVPRHGARLLEGRRGQAAGARRRGYAPRPTSSTGAAASPGPRVNFITAHDGFTLNDLVSYNDKHNEANGEDNRDGHSDNLSWNYGVEGPTDDPEIRALRERQMRNMLATLLLSQGTPMLLAGDEFGRTPAAATTTPTARTTRSAGSTGTGSTRTSRACSRFTRKLIALRQALPMLRRGRFLTGAYDEELGVKDVTWLTPDRHEMDAGATGRTRTPAASACCSTAARRRPASAARHRRDPAAGPQRPSRRGAVHPAGGRRRRSAGAADRHQPAGPRRAGALRVRPRVRGDRPVAAAARSGAGGARRASSASGRGRS